MPYRSEPGRQANIKAVSRFTRPEIESKTLEEGAQSILPNMPMSQLNLH